MKTLGIIRLILVFLLLVYSVRGQGQTAKGEVSGEGVIVAFQKQNRYPEKPFSKGIATFAEYWVVRIDKWAEETGKDQKYILVQFNLYKRGINDSEINSSKLRFSLRGRRADEHTDCLGRVFVGRGRSSETRQAKLSDYQRTKAGIADEIPPLESLSCFIADEPPVVVEGTK
jgi:hypothetical protein